MPEGPALPGHSSRTTTYQEQRRAKKMADPKLKLLHVLAADPPENGKIRTRSTVRSGAPKVGDRFWFEDPDRNRRTLTVVSLNPSPRWWTIVFSGLQQDLKRIVTGTYIRGEAS
jgi:hypothetical protein